jgi:small subunit ribosomal protein S6
LPEGKVCDKIHFNLRGEISSPVPGGELLNRYEVLFVIQPDASEETISEATEKAQDQVTRNGGIILGLENWGRKKLAYEIQRFTEGIYVKMDFEAWTRSPDTSPSARR